MFVGIKCLLLGLLAGDCPLSTKEALNYLKQTSSVAAREVATVLPPVFCKNDFCMLWPHDHIKLTISSRRLREFISWASKGLYFCSESLPRLPPNACIWSLGISSVTTHSPSLTSMKLSICTGLAVNKPTETIYNLFLFIDNVTMILRSKAFDFTTLFNQFIIRLLSDCLILVAMRRQFAITAFGCLSAQWTSSLGT